MSAAISQVQTPLDNPAWLSLTGAHRHLGIVRGGAARYRAEINPFAALERPDAQSLADLATLVRPGEQVAVTGALTDVEAHGFRIVRPLEIRQMVLEQPLAVREPRPESLDSRDAGEMLALADLTRPGPIAKPTIEMGRYVGFRAAGRLVAMGGERLRPNGYVEVSGICTHPDGRTRGLAEAIVRELSCTIQALGATPILHVAIGSPSEAVGARLDARRGERERGTVPFRVLGRLAR
jgi:predicted GNAT family acetyltransferase